MAFVKQKKTLNNVVELPLRQARILIGQQKDAQTIVNYICTV